MKKTNILLLTFFVTAGYILSTINNGYTKIQKPPVSKTNAPSETNCGTTAGCHNTTANTFGGSVTATFDPTTYTPGQVITVTVTTSENLMTRYGFEATMLDASNAKQGDFAIINTATTSLQTSGARQYIGHQSAGTTNSWTFNWTAPNTNAGSLTLYVASICANADGHSSGDHCYTTISVINPNPLGIADANGVTSFMNIQNPITDKLIISYKALSGSNTIIRLFNLNGREVKTLLNENTCTGIQTKSFDAPFNAGIYFVEYLNGHNVEVKKVIVL